MSRKTIFLMGAPSGRLQWDDKDLLKVAVPPFTPSPTPTSTSSRADATKWRVLQSANTSRLHHPEWTQDTLFLDTANLPAKMPRISDDVLLSQFYEHSLSILGASFSSESDNNDTTLPLEEEDSDIDQSIGSAVVTGSTQALPFSYLRELHDIKDIPNAAYLRSIIPQTPSVTLVVAVIGINPLRRVTARQSKQELDILELIVGDETRTGFGVTFWLPVSETHHKQANNPSAEFREKILGIRLRDIVLMRNVGLGAFQDLVYGQSLWRGMTKVELLNRQQIDSQDVQGAYSTVAIDTATREDRLLCKVRSVRDWLMNFVGTKARYGSHIGGQPLPPDTQ